MRAATSGGNDFGALISLAALIVGASLWESRECSFASPAKSARPKPAAPTASRLR
jgi:hypothetical protein